MIMVMPLRRLAFQMDNFAAGNAALLISAPRESQPEIDILKSINIAFIKASFPQKQCAGHQERRTRERLEKTLSELNEAKEKVADI